MVGFSDFCGNEEEGADWSRSSPQCKINVHSEGQGRRSKKERKNSLFVKLGAKPLTFHSLMETAKTIKKFPESRHTLIWHLSTV